jgi:hypothetical protein
MRPGSGLVRILLVFCLAAAPGREARPRTYGSWEFQERLAFYRPRAAVSFQAFYGELLDALGRGDLWFDTVGGALVSWKVVVINN